MPGQENVTWSAVAASLVVGVALGAVGSRLVSGKDDVGPTAAAPPCGSTERGKTIEHRRTNVRVADAASEEVLFQEQCSRNRLFLGEDKFEKLRKSFVIVVGLGGVGSHAAHMLARSGVERIRLIDFDQVSLSSLNRHAVATRADVGVSKVRAMKERLLDIVPALECEAIESIFTGDKAEQLLAGDPDYVLDCIDNLETKAQLIKFCVDRNIPILTSSGAGCRADPTRLRVANVNEVTYDRMARAIRSELRRIGCKTGVKCLYSTERPQVGLSDLTDQQEEDPSSFSTLPQINMRVRILPVIGPLPAIFGQAMAMITISDLTGLELAPQRTERRKSNKFYKKLLDRLVRNEVQLHGDEDPTPDNQKVTVDDIAIVYDQVFGGRSGVSGKQGGANTTTIGRWDKSKQPVLGNLVVLTQAEHRQHYAHEGFSAWSEDVVARVNERLGASVR